MVSDIIKDWVADELKDIGSPGNRSFSTLFPVKNSSKMAIAGSSDNIQTKYVGHVAYSSDLDCLVYQVQKEIPNLLVTSDGRAVSISKKIIHSLKNEYSTEYVFAGIRETGDILVISIEDFQNEWHTKKYDEQYYALLDSDVEIYLHDQMTEVFSEHPKVSDHTITKEEARDRVLD